MKKQRIIVVMDAMIAPIIQSNNTKIIKMRKDSSSKRNVNSILSPPLKTLVTFSLGNSENRLCIGYRQFQLA